MDTPDELRKAMDELERTGNAPDLYAFADAWEMDRTFLRQTGERLEEAERREGGWFHRWESVLCEYNALRKRLEAAEGHADEYASLWHRDAGQLRITEKRLSSIECAECEKDLMHCECDGPAIAKE